MPNPEAKEAREKRINELYTVPNGDYKEAYHKLLYMLRRCGVSYDKSCGKRTLVLRVEDYEDEKSEDLEYLLDIVVR